MKLRAKFSQICTHTEQYLQYFKIYSNFALSFLSKYKNCNINTTSYFYGILCNQKRLLNYSLKSTLSNVQCVTFTCVCTIVRTLEKTYTLSPKTQIKHIYDYAHSTKQT